MLFTPDAHTSLDGYGWTENHLLLITLEDVQTELYVLDRRTRRLDRRTARRRPPWRPPAS